MIDVDVTARAVILRPRAEVAEYAANPDNKPRWQTHIKTVAWETAKPVAVGSVFSFNTRFMGLAMGYTYEVVEFVAGERIVMRTAADDSSEATMETSYSWESLGTTATHMVLRNRGTISGMGAFMMGPIMSLGFRLGMQTDLKRLKKLLERSGLARG